MLSETLSSLSAGIISLLFGSCVNNRVRFRGGTKPNPYTGWLCDLTAEAKFNIRWDFTDSSEKNLEINE